MPSDEFVQRMHKEIADQEKKAYSLREEKLHDAKVIATAGPHVWSDLKRELMDCLTKITTLSSTQTGDSSLELGYGNERLKVRLDIPTAVIHYEGMMGKGGKFESRVSGEELVYSVYDRRYTIADIAEQLIETLVQRR